MEPMFKVVFKVNGNTLKDLCRYTSFQRPSRIVFNIILLIAFLADLLITIFGGYMEGALIAVPLLYLLEVILYFRAVSLSIKRSKEMKHENEFTTYEFFENHFLFTSSNGGKTEVSLRDIIRLKKTKKFILLSSNAKMMYWFPVDSFEVGNFEEFKLYLCIKGIKVK